MQRILVGAVFVLGIAASAGKAAAQLIDPSTGMMVYAVDDPADFSAVASGQPGNIGTELMAKSVHESREASAAMPAASSSLPGPVMDAAVRRGPDAPLEVLRTVAPEFLVSGVSAQGVVSLRILDGDSRASIYFTVDGSEPTAMSPVYTHPIAVVAGATVRAMAVHSPQRDSAVVLAAGVGAAEKHREIVLE